MNRTRVIREFWEFLRQEKKFWLLPIVMILGVLGLLLVFGQSSMVAPFVYTMF